VIGPLSPPSPTFLISYPSPNFPDFLILLLPLAHSLPLSLSSPPILSSLRRLSPLPPLSSFFLPYYTPSTLHLSFRYPLFPHSLPTFSPLHSYLSVQVPKRRAVLQRLSAPSQPLLCGGEDSSSPLFYFFFLGHGSAGVLALRALPPASHIVCPATPTAGKKLSFHFSFSRSRLAMPWPAIPFSTAPACSLISAVQSTGGSRVIQTLRNFCHAFLRSADPFPPLLPCNTHLFFLPRF